MSQTYFPTPGTNLTGFSEDRKKNGMRALDSVDGLAQKNARMWQIISLVSLSSFFIALGVLIYAVNLPKTIPVIVTVDSTTGKAEYVGKIDKSLYGKEAIPEIAKIYQMKELITKMYTKYIDRSAQQVYIDEAYALVQKGAVGLLDNFFRQNNPYQDFGKYVQTVDIQEPLKQTDKTYFVNFTVVKKHLEGYILSEEEYTALINLDFYDSVPESNVLGIYIVNFDITKKNKGA